MIEFMGYTMLLILGFLGLQVSVALLTRWTHDRATEALELKFGALGREDIEALQRDTSELRKLIATRKGRK